MNEDSNPTQAAGDSYFEHLDELLQRAGEGQDVAGHLAQLPSAVQAEFSTILQAQGLVAGPPQPAPAPTPMPAMSIQGVHTDRKLHSVIAGRFEVSGELGRGGMGVVYKATDPLGHAVVIKALAQDRVWTPRVLSRFEREGQALRKIHRHPNLVHVLDSGQDPNWGPYIVMEFVEGLPLERIIRQRGRLAPEHAARFAMELARGLAVVHRHGLLHRDVKPANVIITPTGNAKLVDFGLAKDLFLSSMTKTGQILGTSTYMAPEQWGLEDGAKVDERCDVFALGATLYHMLVGRPPFLGESIMEVREACLAGDYEPPSELVDGIPPQLEDVVLQMLMAERRFRHFRMANVAADLERVLRGQRSLVPCLVDERNGARHSLMQGRRWTVGREESCQIHVADGSVSRRHAQLRREDRGYVLRDLDSSHGTRVGGKRISDAYVLSDGDAVQVGNVRMTFQDANAAPQPPAILRDVTRTERPEPVLAQLEVQGDPRVLLNLLEHVTASPKSEQRWLSSLASLLDPGAAEIARRCRAHRRAAALARLQAISGQDLPDHSDAWLAWWDHARAEHPEQILAPGPLPHLQIHASGPGADLSGPLDLGQSTVLLIGRDPKCHLRIGNPSVSRLHLTLFRLHRRLVARDEGSAAGTTLNGATVTYAFFDPGDRIELGGIELLLGEIAPPPAQPPRGTNTHQVDPATFDGLVEAGHPSVATALVGLLYENQRLDWIDAVAQELYPQEEARAAFSQGLRDAYAARTRRALERLPSLLGSQAPDAGSWSKLLAQRRPNLGIQVVPAGWLRASRD